MELQFLITLILVFSFSALYIFCSYKQILRLKRTVQIGDSNIEKLWNDFTNLDKQITIYDSNIRSYLSLDSYLISRFNNFPYVRIGCFDLKDDEGVKEFSLIKKRLQLCMDALDMIEEDDTFYPIVTDNGIINEPDFLLVPNSNKLETEPFLADLEKDFIMGKDMNENKQKAFELIKLMEKEHIHFWNQQE